MTKSYSRKTIFNELGDLLPVKNRTYTTNEGHTCIVIDGGTKRNYVTIKIGNWETEVTNGNLKKGNIKYPLHKSVLGKGYIGIGTYKGSKSSKNSKAYETWRSMLMRVFDKTYHNQPIKTQK